MAPPLPAASLSASELVKLNIEAAAASDAMLCCWASKAGVAPALRCINAWGAKYVENLTWVHLTAGGGIAALTPPHNAPVRASHSTLVMGRRGSGAAPRAPSPTLPRRAPVACPERGAVSGRGAENDGDPAAGGGGRGAQVSGDCVSGRGRGGAGGVGDLGARHTVLGTHLMGMARE